MAYHHGSGRSGGRGRGRGRGSGGRGSGGGGGGGGGASHGDGAKLRPCTNYTTTGACPRGASCTFSHVVKLHASIDASTMKPQQQNRTFQNRYDNNQQDNSKFYAVSSVSIWETNGAIKIFSGSHDGHWRLWNTQGGTFHKEFEHSIGNRVECLTVASNFLFCGFEAVSLSLPDIKVGMIFAWNLARPTDPPLEFHMQPNVIPYAHAGPVTSLAVEGDKIVSGSRDGAIRIWSYDAANNRFGLLKSLDGHAKEVTGLQIVDSILWSSSIDKSIRLWNLASGECQYVITNTTTQTKPAAPPPTPQPNIETQKGHTDAVTSLLKFPSPSGTFVLSSSLDGTIKAWNGSNGECVASETHGSGVVCMALTTDPSGKHPLLLVGVEWGNIMVRNLIQTPKTPAFGLLMTLSSKYSAGHQGAVKALCAGPSSTFYSGGDDGKVLVWQITDDLGL